MGVRLELFANEAEPREYGVGEVIFQTWDMGAEMYVVLEGEVEISIDGKVLETLGPGGIFGEMALIDQAPRVATASPKAPCKLAVIPERRFLFLVQQCPDFALYIMKVMADRLRKMNERV